jgi:hypothetical protein
MKIRSFSLVSLSLEIFALNSQTHGCLYPLLSQIFLSNQASYALEVNRFLTYPIKQDMTHSFDLVLFTNGVAIFFVL